MYTGAGGMIANIFQVFTGHADTHHVGADHETISTTPKIYAGRNPPDPVQLEQDALRSVFLFTDGLANEGITDVALLVCMHLCVYVWSKMHSGLCFSSRMVLKMRAYTYTYIHMYIFTHIFALIERYPCTHTG